MNPPIPHSYGYDPTCGCDEAALAAISLPPEPDGFAAFWRGTRAAADAVPLRLRRASSSTPCHGGRLSVVHFDSLGGYRIGAWLLEPEGICRSGLIQGHGYGGRGGAELADPDFPAPEDVAVLAPCQPGFDLSAGPSLPAEASSHVVHGIDSPDTYILRYCVAALWSATRALAELRPEIAGRLAYEGGSFGGGLGALAAPWEPLWSCVRLDVPTFGHHPWRLRCPSNGSGEAVRQFHLRRPEIAATLAYYDAAIAASHARMPAFLVPALFDPTVPPPGQWAVANAWGGPRTVSVARSGHHDGEWTAGEKAAQQRGWLELRRRHQLD